MTNHLRNKHGLRKAKASKARKFLGPWFRAYAVDIDDYRLQSLPAQVKWIWFELSCIASLSNGALPDHDQLAFRLRREPHELTAAIDVLISAGLVVQPCLPGSDPTLMMAGWDSRQFVADRSADRMRRLRDRRADHQPRDSTCDVTCDGKSDDKTVISSYLLSHLGETYLRSIHESSIPGSNDSYLGGVDGSKLGGRDDGSEGGVK